MIADHPDRFSTISIGNTGLPYMPNTPTEIIEQVSKFRQSKNKLTIRLMAKEVMKMDNRKTHPALKFMYWQKFCWDTEDLPIGFLNSIMMEKNSRFKILINYIFMKLGMINISPYISDLMKAYNAPFPSNDYKICLLYTSPSPRDRTRSRMPSSA